MIIREHIDRLLEGNGNVIGQDGERIGGIGQFYVDDVGNEPSWVTVKTGLFGTRESFVPLEGARMEGDDLVVAYTKEQVKEAPSVDPEGHLDLADEDLLYEHYRMGGLRTARGQASVGVQEESVGVPEEAGTFERGDYGEAGYVAADDEQTGYVRKDEQAATRPVGDTLPVGNEQAGYERGDYGDAGIVRAEDEQAGYVQADREDMVSRPRLRKYLTTERPPEGPDHL
ncbi:PRC-barrel domain-containing protein [Arthrobacter sp. ISL-30]|uniref:PRC-barrel domain-containing protein n=1 Tax=Arthrobacter sp. ISL-30 TaxID=2819109 RepID=UPI001BE5A6AA|nr:PRC-barrel domain-containing protein [Arthrobacter sp. ISL-30]MBT2514990.1 PRC-barrel domain-containing protein [Arthrobacter sp. ISL-30]